jgi:hypothetical protein
MLESGDSGEGERREKKRGEVPSFGREFWRKGEGGTPAAADDSGLLISVQWGGEMGEKTRVVISNSRGKFLEGGEMAVVVVSEFRKMLLVKVDGLWLFINALLGATVRLSGGGILGREGMRDAGWSFSRSARLSVGSATSRLEVV